MEENDHTARRIPVNDDLDVKARLRRGDLPYECTRIVASETLRVSCQENFKRECCVKELVNNNHVAYTIPTLDRPFGPYFIPTLELTLTRILFRLRFSLLPFFVIACLTFVPVACWYIGSPVHLFLIWLFSLLLFAILLAAFAFECRVRVQENVRRSSLMSQVERVDCVGIAGSYR